MVDWWKDGFPATRFEIDHKLVQMTHSLGIMSNNPNPAPAPVGWTIADDGSAAVWDRGFAEFLAHGDELQAVLNILGVTK